MQAVQRIKEGWRKISGNVYFQIAFFLLASFLEFAILEMYFGVSIFSYPPDILLKNVLLISVSNLLLTGLFHSIKIPLLISAVFFTLIGVANYFVEAFRGYGIVFMDFYAVSTAAEVAGGYKYQIAWDFVTALLSDMALFGACLLLPGRKHAYCHVKYTVLSMGGVLASLLFFLWINFDTPFFSGVSSLTWDHHIGMEKYGYVLYFTSNAGKVAVKEPEGYSVERVGEVLSQYQEEGENQAQNGLSEKKQKKWQLPNLIMIMNESYSDLSVLGKFTTNQAVMPFYHSLTENTIKGYAHSSVYGGYTANSEFEFLTGCTKAFLPGNPYLQYIDDYLPSLITVLKGQGYDEAVAIHPYHPSGYSRNRIYPLLGFDRFLSLEDFGQEALVRDFVGDMEDYRKIEELYEQKEEGTPLCIFNVTMQNHNPYDNTKYVFENPVHMINTVADRSVNQYLSLMKMSDDALKELITYFKKVEEPTVIVLFGDHQPHLPDSFYKKVMGCFPSEFSQEQVMQEHLVPFLIWTNYGIKEQEIGQISLNYLAELMLECAGLHKSSYLCYLSDLRKKIPSISASGYYDKEGKLYPVSDDSPKSQDLKIYEMVQYHYLFDKEKRLSDYFTVP